MIVSGVLKVVNAFVRAVSPNLACRGGVARGRRLQSCCWTPGIDRAST